MSRWNKSLTAAALVVLALAAPSHAQRWGWGMEPDLPDPPPLEVFPGNTFTFCTIRYRSIRSEALGLGWYTDFPDSGYNFMLRLEEITTIPITRDQRGEPDQLVLRLTDPALFNHPYVFMSDVGTVGFNEEETGALRRYLLCGGFLHVDDFWGDEAWDHWVSEFSRVLPPDEYPIEDIPLDDVIFHIVFDVDELPQVPSIQHWRGSRTTSERGRESEQPHIRGVRNKQGAIIVLMSHNTDIADGWEKEGEDFEYFKEFSVRKSYPLGINIVVYAMTH